MFLSKERLEGNVEHLRKTVEEMNKSNEDRLAALGAMFVEYGLYLYPNRSTDPRPYRAMDSVSEFLFTEFRIEVQP